MGSASGRSSETAAALARMQKTGEIRDSGERVMKALLAPLQMQVCLELRVSVRVLKWFCCVCSRSVAASTC